MGTRRDPTSPDHPTYETTEAIERLVARFEACTLRLPDWDHAAHLTVAMWYSATMSRAEAAHRIVTGIQQFNAHHADAPKAPRYHETLTRFWIDVVHLFAARYPTATPLELVNRFVATFRERKKVFLEFYESDTIFGDRARRGFIAPNRRPLDGSTLDNVLHGAPAPDRAAF